MSGKQFEHDTSAGGFPCSRCGMRYSPKTAYIPCFIEGDTLGTWALRHARQLLECKDYLPSLLVEMAEAALKANPSPRSPKEASSDPAYEVVRDYVHGNYWPGGEDIVVKHKASGTFWLAVYAVSADDSDYGSPTTSWKPVVPEVVTTTRYNPL